MTTAQALGLLVWYSFDQRPLTGRARARVMEAIPPQCRFLDAEGRIENHATITMLWEHLHEMAHKGQYPPTPIVSGPEWTEDEMDAAGYDL